MKILDVCCGSRMFWFDKKNQETTFMDLYPRYEELDSGHVVDVNPDCIADFRNIPFNNQSFDLVVFDPPHLVRAGDASWLAKKYGKLNKDTWEADLLQGFKECRRVMKQNATLIFKWNEDQIKISEIKRLIDKTQLNLLFGNKRGKTHWLVLSKSKKELPNE